jgi:methoxymalonate biosynthesis acyl carrier protein
MEQTTILTKTKAFLQRYVGEKEIQPDDEIFASGMVNSLFAMQLVLFLEKEFDLEINSRDLDLKNFSSLNAITVFILGKK